MRFSIKWPGKNHLHKRIKFYTYARENLFRRTTLPMAEQNMIAQKSRYDCHKDDSTRVVESSLDCHNI